MNLETNISVLKFVVFCVEIMCKLNNRTALEAAMNNNIFESLFYLLSNYYNELFFNSNFEDKFQYRNFSFSSKFSMAYPSSFYIPVSSATFVLYNFDFIDVHELIKFIITVFMKCEYKDRKFQGF
jgi:hypothetical protein